MQALDVGESKEKELGTSSSSGQSWFKMSRTILSSAWAVRVSRYVLKRARISSKAQQQDSQARVRQSNSRYSWVARADRQQGQCSEPWE